MGVLPFKPKYVAWQLLNEDGQTLVEYKSFISFDFSAISTSPTQPVEQGSFASYNKIEKPYDVKVSIAFDSGFEGIEDAIATIKEQNQLATLLTIITPEQTINDITLVGYKYTRSSATGSITLDLSFLQVKEVTPEFSNTNIAPAQAKNKSNASKTDRGKVQAQEPEQESSILSRLAS